MNKFEKLYWDFFNYMAKIIALGFVLIGGVISLWLFSLLVRPQATIDINGTPTNSFLFKFVCFFFVTLVPVMGVLMLKAPKWYPKSRK